MSEPQKKGYPSESVSPSRESHLETHHSSHSPQQSPPTHSPTHSDTAQTESEDEGMLETSAGRDEVTQLLRSTVEELELALEDSRKLLAERDEELVKVRAELERYRQQAAREIANKTKLAQSLDESHLHAQELEELLQKWQLEFRESKIHRERLETTLHQEHSRCEYSEKQLSSLRLEKDKEMEELKAQLSNAQQKLSSMEQSSRRSSLAESSNPGVEHIDKMQLHFLKQAVYHLLTDFHAEDQIRAILSILDFSAQERKAVYAKVEEKKKYSRGLYM